MNTQTLNPSVFDLVRSALLHRRTWLAIVPAWAIALASVVFLANGVRALDGAPAVFDPVVRVMTQAAADGNLRVLADADAMPVVQPTWRSQPPKEGDMHWAVWDEGSPAILSLQARPTGEPGGEAVLQEGAEQAVFRELLAHQRMRLAVKVMLLLVVTFVVVRVGFGMAEQRAPR